MTPVDRDRLEKCLALAEHGATAGERQAALAAAARIAAGAGLTLAEATRAARSPRTASTGARPPPRRTYAWAEPKAAIVPITVEELLCQKAATEAWRKRAAAAETRRRRRAHADQAAYAAEQRAKQAERDRDWAHARAGTGGAAVDDP